MISATGFARIHSSTWKSLAPTTDLYVKKINGFLASRQFPRIDSVTAPQRRAFINEIGFELFAGAARTEGRSSWQNVSNLECAIRAARERVRQFGDRSSEELADPSKEEEQECGELGRRLHEYFRTASDDKPVNIHPNFPGCGFVDACVGDVHFYGTLYEVKAGQRAFLSTDVRQLLTYVALSKASRAWDIDRIGLVNPRTGVSFVTSIEDVCSEVAGRPTEELLSEIIRIISSGDTSR
jgi:hypothetical protein